MMAIRRVQPEVWPLLLCELEAWHMAGMKLIRQSLNHKLYPYGVFHC